MDAEVADRTEQQRVREQVTRSFGWKPVSVRFPKRGSALRGAVYFVKVAVGVCVVEFMFARGLLVGIPPSKRGQH